MSRWERYGTRDLAFSDWQRTLPEWSKMIDLDGVMYCKECDEPFLFIEAAQDVGQRYKATTITRKVANKCKVPAWLVFYTTNEDGKIISFRVKQVAPIFSKREVVMPQDKLGKYVYRLLCKHQARSGCNNHRNPLRRREAR